MESTNNIFTKMIKKIRTYGELVMFSHTLFSLPFALIALFIASNGLPRPELFFWIMVCLFAGRNGANALNRYVDQKYDAMNPRTASRHMPKGIVKSREVLIITALCYALFVFAAYQINMLCFYLSPIALGLFTLYSYTKRFTWLCHLVLGITCAGAPVGAWIAVTGGIDLIPIVLGAVVMLWVSGFDIVYGTQDIDFDRSVGLFSIPAKFGLSGALTIARVFHLMMWLLLIVVGILGSLGIIYYIGVGISALLLLIEHGIIDPGHRMKMNFAAYHINQLISTLLLITTAFDIFL
ncbi:UbiA-like polyprenyltransferase [Fusibacter bizertensis]